MKRIAILLCLVLLLAGCSGSDGELDRAMNLRSKLLARSVSFDAQITADYADKTYTFTMNCAADTQGNLTFTVIEPELISGISGTVSATGGKLTFDDVSLAFDLMADGQFSPVSGPWVLMKTLRSGYLTSCNREGDALRISIDDSYRDDALHLDIWLNNEDVPIRGEIMWKGRRLLTIDVKNFTFV
ncbi:MAG: hypothetical protein IJN60_02290 [Oscillospiraceae bacterium]|nr:hypothetical protein [Oscillospiraceae bacterium]